MAFRRQPQREARPAQVITAAATLIDVTSETQAREQRGRVQQWQKDSWNYFDELGEVRFPARYMGDGLAKLRIFGAYRPDPESDPVAVTDPKADENAKRAEPYLRVLIDRLKGPEGTHATVLRGSGLNVHQAGEGYLVGGMIPEFDDQRETWDVFSVEELVADPNLSGSKYALKPEPNAKPSELITLGEDVFVMRVWRRHPRWSNWADSALRGCLTICEELSILTQAVMATATSRIPAGILGVSQDASFGANDSDDDDSTEDKDDLTAQLIKHIGAAIREPRAASRLVPIILRMDKEDLQATKLFEFSRDTDRLFIDLRNEAIERLATAMDFPNDILTGKADLNHWTSWQVREEADREVLNLADLVFPALTRGYLQPSLAKMENAPDDVRRYFLWYDASALTSRPNQAQDYAEAHERFAVSDAAYRRSKRIPDEDKPTDAEVERRIAIARAVRSNDPIEIPPAGPDNVQPGPARTPIPGSDEAITAAAITEHVTQPATEIEAPDLGEVQALTAAGRRQNLGRTLAEMERGLRARIQSEADAALHRGLERAGNRLRTLARRDPAAWRTIENVDPELVAATLGPAVVSALLAARDETPDMLLADAFAKMKPRYEAWVANAQREATREVVRRAPREPSDDEIDRYERELAADREEGWGHLETAMYVLAAARLFTPEVEVPARGEFDSTTLVPPGIVRESLTIAGGGPADDRAGGGALTGAAVARLLVEAGLRTTGYVWVYGDPGSRTTPFEPHADLDGAEFESWDDEVLSNSEGWPETDYFAPGDHDWCQCEYERRVEDVPEDAALVAAQRGGEHA